MSNEPKHASSDAAKGESPQHTPGPWRCREMGSEGSLIFPDTHDKHELVKYIARVNGRDTLTDFANAVFIVQACNAHDDLLAACELMVSYAAAYKGAYPDNVSLRDLDKARAAIAKAEGSE